MCSLLRQILFLALTGLSSAFYYIDNTNSTVTYTGTWTVFNDVVAFNKSFSFTTCPDCRMEIPFTGSGIVVNVIRSYDANVTVQLDDGPTKSVSFVKNIDNPYNFTLFQAQSLPFAAHKVDVTLKSFPPGGYRDFEFDFAEVNDTNPNPGQPTTTTASTAPSSTTSAASSQSGQTNSSKIIGAAVGGALGGVAILSAIFFALFIRRRHQRRRYNGEIALEPKRLGSVVSLHTLQHTTTHTPPSSPPPSAPWSTFADAAGPALGRAHSPTMTTRTSDDIHPHAPSTTTTPTRSRRRTLSSPTSNGTESLRRKGERIIPPRTYGAPNSLPTATENSEPNSSTYSTSSPTSTSPASVGPSLAGTLPSISADPSNPTNMLTPEQINFVHGLHNHNVPVAEIAAIMETMRTARIETGSGAIPDYTISESEAPPQYSR